MVGGRERGRRGEGGEDKLMRRETRRRKKQEAGRRLGRRGGGEEAVHCAAAGHPTPPHSTPPHPTHQAPAAARAGARAHVEGLAVLAGDERRGGDLLFDPAQHPQRVLARVHESACARVCVLWEEGGGEGQEGASATLASRSRSGGGGGGCTDGSRKSGVRMAATASRSGQQQRAEAAAAAARRPQAPASARAPVLVRVCWSAAALSSGRYARSLLVMRLEASRTTWSQRSASMKLGNSTMRGYQERTCWGGAGGGGAGSLGGGRTRRERCHLPCKQPDPALASVFGYPRISHYCTLEPSSARPPARARARRAWKGMAL